MMARTPESSSAPSPPCASVSSLASVPLPVGGTGEMGDDPDKEHPWATLDQLLRSENSFVVTCHRAPDADALGSAAALTELLVALGKDARLFLPERVPEHLEFLYGGVPTTADVVAGQTVLITDTPSPGLLPERLVRIRSSLRCVVIDHHSSYQVFGDLELRDETACSTGSMVLDLFRRFRVKVSPRVATQVYAAMVTDTLGFRGNRVDAGVFHDAAFLVESGADPESIARRMFDAWTPRKLKLFQRALDTLTFHCDQRVASMTICDRSSDIYGETDGFVDIMMRGSTVVAAVLVIDGGADECKLRFRSKGPLNVAVVAQRMGGGGHSNAAATVVAGNLEQWLPRAVSALSSMVDLTPGVGSRA